MGLAETGHILMRQLIRHLTALLSQMELTMIKPFKIISTTEEDQGRIGVVYEVSKVVVLVDGEDVERRKKTLTAYISLPAEADVDQEVFNAAQSGGWIQ